jgi:tetratricopeptide (TPR) repeat protein
MEVTTSRPEAQELFDQGLRLTYAFNHEEAWRSFKEAARIDPDCAMAYWGIAYTLGGNYNVPGSVERLETAAKAITLAKNLRVNAGERERDLIDAMSERYALPVPEDDDERKKLDKAYAEAMTKVAQKYPDDDNIQTMYAESLMMLRPWALFEHDGTPAEGTMTILETLDRVIARNPEHTGANHLAIHAWEASKTPERALPSADRLASLAPNAGHLVHMPSHIYIRTGMYEKSVESNRAAIAADDSYLNRIGGGYVYGGMYAPHNWHMLVTSDMMIGNAEEAISMSREMTQRASTNLEALKQAPGADFVINNTWLMLARFGKWKDVLEEAAPPDDFEYAKASWHFARGRAFVGMNRLEEAKQELAVLTSAEEWVPEGTMGPYATDPAINVIKVAAEVLGGVIADAEGNHEEAEKLLREAVVQEDTLRYGEPPTWHAPSRQTLGALLIQRAEQAREQGDESKAAELASAAEEAFRNDMKRHPNNGWSLYGLAQALKLQNKAEAQSVLASFNEVWKLEEYGQPTPPQWGWY